MCNAKINLIFILFLILQIQTGYGRPQGFKYIPILYSRNNEFLTIVSKVEQSTVLGPYNIYVFKLQNSVDNNIDITKTELHQLDNANKIGQGEDKLTVGQDLNSIAKGIDSVEKTSNENNKTRKFTNDHEEKESNNKFNVTVKNTTEFDNKVDDAATTTESVKETTTLNIETTTDDIYDRGNAALIATMLG